MRFHLTKPLVVDEMLYLTVFSRSFKFILSGRVLFHHPGNLPELPGLCPVAVRKRMANPVEVVAMPVT